MYDVLRSELDAIASVELAEVLAVWPRFTDAQAVKLAQYLRDETGANGMLSAEQLRSSGHPQSAQVRGQAGRMIARCDRQTAAPVACEACGCERHYIVGTDCPGATPADVCADCGAHWPTREPAQSEPDACAQCSAHRVCDGCAAEGEGFGWVTLSAADDAEQSGAILATRDAHARSAAGEPCTCGYEGPQWEGMTTCAHCGGMLASAVRDADGLTARMRGLLAQASAADAPSAQSEPAVCRACGSSDVHSSGDAHACRHCAYGWRDSTPADDPRIDRARAALCAGSPSESDLFGAEYARLRGPDLGFPPPLAGYLARRALAAGWLPVRDPLRPAGADNLRSETAPSAAQQFARVGETMLTAQQCESIGSLDGGNGLNLSDEPESLTDAALAYQWTQARQIIDPTTRDLALIAATVAEMSARAERSEPVQRPGMTPRDEHDAAILAASAGVADASGVDWGGRNFGELSPDEQRKVSGWAARELSREMTSPEFADAVSEVMSEPAADDRDALIAQAREMSPDEMSDISDGPGRLDGCADRELATALEVIIGSGCADATAGGTETGSHLARVGRFILATDSQGFIDCESFPTVSAAQAILDARDAETGDDIDN